MQKSVLKVNEGRTFSAPGCQGVSCFLISRTTSGGRGGEGRGGEGRGGEEGRRLRHEDFSDIL